MTGRRLVSLSAGVTQFCSVVTAISFDEDNVAGPKGLLKPTAGGFRIRQEKRAYS